MEYSMKTLTEADLNMFTGTGKYFKHWLGIVYTDGVKYVAESAGAYWLIDLVASYRRKEPFQVWELTVKNGKATATMREDSNEPILVCQEIAYTDFPLDYIKLYLIDGVLLLPSEY